MLKATSRLASPIMILLLVTSLAAVSSSAAAQTFTSLDVPGATVTQAYDISDSGLIVGRYVDGAGVHGFVYDGTTFTPIDYPGATWTAAWGVNKNGDIVGQYAYADSLIHGFLLTGDTFTNIDYGQFNTMPQGINRAGYIVGCIHNSGTMHGWVMRNADFLSVSSAYGMYTGVNDSGTVVGWYLDASTMIEHGFALSGVGNTDFRYPGAAITEPQGINSAGDIVGSYSPTGAKVHGFLLHDGNPETIDYPSAASTRAFGINNAGTIVGVYNEGHTHGFVRVP